MGRLLIFTAGLVAGIGVAFVSGLAPLQIADAAPFEPGKLKPRTAAPQVEPQFLEQRCAPGFRHTPNAAGRYGCNRVAALRCPDGRAPVNARLYRDGSASSSGARLLYDCRMSESVQPRCARGYLPSNLNLYRAGTGQGQSRLIYECVRHRKGN